MPAATLYKNFMGISGPGGLNYGLSKRLVQLYLLCLVREGRHRITLSGRNLPADVIDYSNIASIDFKTAVLDAFDQVQRLKPPEGWEMLAPFAAAILDDPALQKVREDAEIQIAVTRLLKFMEEQTQPVQGLRTDLADLFQELAQPNPLDERLAAWEKFLKSPVEAADPIPYLRLAVEKSFAYPIYHQDELDPADVDDLIVRRAELEQARKFLGHSERVRAAYRYAQSIFSAELQAQEPALSAIQRKLDLVRDQLSSLAKLVSNESGLLSELLEPAADAIQSYSTRYLQAFDRVVSHTEQARQRILELSQTPDFQTLDRLGHVQQLGASPVQPLNERFGKLAASDELFPALPDPGDGRAAVEPLAAAARLSANPGKARPPFSKAPMQLSRQAEQALQAALLEKAALLHSDAVRSRLEQGRGEPFIAAILAAADTQSMASVLVHCIGQAPPEEASANIEKLARYLHRIQVRKVSLSDFQPGKRTIETSDVDQITQEFRDFLLSALQTGNDDEFPIIEIQ